jgi:hypothetical protein
MVHSFFGATLLRYVISYWSVLANDAMTARFAMINPLACREAIDGPDHPRSLESFLSGCFAQIASYKGLA